MLLLNVDVCNDRLIFHSNLIWISNQSMDWFFFILLNAAFFIRPVDLVQSANIPLYNILMMACLVVSGGRVVSKVFSAQRCAVTACVLGVVAACFLSHMSHANLRRAADDGFYFVKIVTYYLLLVAVVDSTQRLDAFLRWIVRFTLMLTFLAVAHYHGVLVISSLEACMQRDIDAETGELQIIPRLCSTGVFNDPNDLSMILVLASILCLYFIDGERGAFKRLGWLAALGLSIYALKLTYSRGGLLNLGLSLAVLSWYRLGARKTLMLSAIALPVMLALFGGRMTRVDVTSTNDTSQDRIQLWSQGLDLFRESPLFGIGMNNYADRAGLVAHNSFVHSYAELGFLGGMFFAGAFYAALAGVWRLGGNEVTFYDPTLKRLRPYVLAMICSCCVGLFSLSRTYTITTYVLLGIAASYLQVVETRTSMMGQRFDAQFVQRLLLIGVAALLFLYAFVRLTVRWQ